MELDNRSERARILVVDDEESMRHLLDTVLRGEGYEVSTAGDAVAALAMLATAAPDVVLTDVRMPGEVDGIGLAEAVRREGYGSAVVVMSAYGSRDLAMEAIRKGAFTYVNKPFTADDLLLTVGMAAERARLVRENRYLRRAAGADAGPGSMVGRSRAMQAVYAMIAKVAPYRSTVLVTGENGTGKELVARAVHQESPRRSKPFVAVNCGAIPETLIESELFGHAKGAFTGAHAAKKGLVEEAAGGTLFLDEIGELPASVQVKLLRFLQEDEVRRVGETKAVRADVRVVAATSRDLQAEVRQGRFREDLFFRLNVLPIHLPPLRERKEDIPLLVEHFLERFARKAGEGVKAISPDALETLVRHGWPGNVRELENALERAAVLCGGSEIGAGDLPEKLRARAPAATGPAPTGADAIRELFGEDLSVKRAFGVLEKELIRRALGRTAGNRTQAAALLDLSPRALSYKIRDYGLE